jgi:hypothetical protein
VLTLELQPCPQKTRGSAGLSEGSCFHVVEICVIVIYSAPSHRPGKPRLRRFSQGASSARACCCREWAHPAPKSSNQRKQTRLLSRHCSISYLCPSRGTLILSDLSPAMQSLHPNHACLLCLQLVTCEMRKLSPPPAIRHPAA